MNRSKTLNTTLAASCVLAAIAAGCTDSGPARDSLTVTDSAGVRIVNNIAPSWGPQDAWRLSTGPVLEFGERESLHRAGTALRLSDGRFAVLHGSAMEILLYSSGGVLQHRFGREGSGPGEFREPSRMYRIRDTDSLLVFDFVLSRGSVFDAAGQLVRTFSTAGAGSAFVTLISGVFADGSLLIMDQPVTSPDTRGLVRPMQTLRRFDPGSGSRVPLVELKGSERFWQDSPWGGIDMRRPYFGHGSAWVAGADRVFSAGTDTFTIRVHSMDGRLHSVIRKRHDAVPVQRGVVSELIEKQIANVEDEADKRLARRTLENIPVAGNVPAFGWPVWAATRGPEFQLDADDNLWVVEFAMPGEETNARTVFDPSGRWLGSVQLPLDFSPTQIGSDFVLGTGTDDLGVESIRVYALIKP